LAFIHARIDDANRVVGFCRVKAGANAGRNPFLQRIAPLFPVDDDPLNRAATKNRLSRLVQLRIDRLGATAMRLKCLRKYENAR
jgi:hypothetical protein